jgi:DNA (cytosine-5)-methyltransferase 1
MAIKVAELFAGVGGFRIGLEGYPRKKNAPYQVIWSNQWEPSTKTQHANIVYKARWKEGIHVGEDISSVQVKDIPNHDLLVGGFPCQDYSVATTLKNSGGLIGKKGVLWWQIYRILEEKGDKRPKYLMLENVDRLLKSPAQQRGRDFAMILSSLNNLGYAVEWRVINAAEYGMPQRRRRVFILGYHKTTQIYKSIDKLKDKHDWIIKEGVIAKGFPVSSTIDNSVSFELSSDLVDISSTFNTSKDKKELFENSGLMIGGKITSAKTFVKYKGPYTTLEDVLQPLHEVEKEFIIDTNSLQKWIHLKGAKKEKRYNKANNFWYDYSEGGMIFPDALDNASRTIITGEGGASPSRFKHVVNQNGTMRRLTPIELERLNMFPDNHTSITGITNTKRAFFMGNALVVGVIEKLGVQLFKAISKE